MRLRFPAILFLIATSLVGAENWTPLWQFDTGG
jgi:hypothetical protein